MPMRDSPTRLPWSLRIHHPSEMLLPKTKPHIPVTRLLARLPDIPRREVRPAEIHTHIHSFRGGQAVDVAAAAQAVAHAAEQLRKVGPAEVGAALELGEGVERGADAVEVDVSLGVGVHALGEVSVDAQEAGPVRGGAGGRLRLRLQRGQQGLEPLEGGGVLAHPDELHPPQPLRRVGQRPQVPDVLEDRRPRRDADAGADEDGDLVVEDVFRRRAVRPVDADRGHHLPLLERHLVHLHGVDGVVFFGLGGAGPEGVGHLARPVAHLADVDADVGVEGAGGDGEGVPLLAGDGGDVDEEPLPGFVFHAGFGELELKGVVRVADDFDDLCGASSTDLAVEALEEIQAACN